MPLKTKDIVIPPQVEGARENRDAGKVYRLTEMPALKAERWARHAVSACNRTDLNVTDETARLGMLGFYLVGFQALAGGDVQGIDALMDEMMGQIQIVASAGVVRPAIADGDIEEVQTIVMLRKELLELHMGFTFAELALSLAQQAKQTQDSQATQTSPT
jgi:hypothetical protein